MRLNAKSIALFLSIFATTAGNAQYAWSVSVTGQVDREALHVGDTLNLTITGRRLPADPGFVGASVAIPSHWLRGGQSVASPMAIGDTVFKQWQFQLVPTMPGSTQVTPIALYGAEVALGASVDSVRGAPVWVLVRPQRVPLMWPWFLAGAIAIVVTLGLTVRTLRQRRAAEYARSDEPPLEEALRMLESIRVNRREDRARQYLIDIEHVIHGYVSRRLDVSLSGLTPTEIGQRVTQRCNDSETAESLTGLLKRCAESKFAGADIRFDALSGIEGQARTVLERLEAKWV